MSFDPIFDPSFHKIILAASVPAAGTTAYQQQQHLYLLSGQLDDGIAVDCKKSTGIGQVIIYKQSKGGFIEQRWDNWRWEKQKMLEMGQKGVRTRPIAESAVYNKGTFLGGAERMMLMLFVHNCILGL